MSSSTDEKERIPDSDRGEAYGNGFGLVLGAGGAFAWPYHLGVVEGLSDSGLYPPLAARWIVGTSAGAAVAAALVAGTSTAEFLDALASAAPRGFVRELHTLASTSRSEVWQAAMEAARHLATGGWREDRRGRVPTGVLPTGSVADLPIGYHSAWDERLWVTAVRAHDRETVIFGRDIQLDRVGEAVEASLAVPFVFQPKTIDGVQYVDGAVNSGTHADSILRDQPSVAIVSAPMCRRGGGLRERARQQLASEVQHLRVGGVRTLVLVPDEATMAAGAGYPLSRREARGDIVAAARRQTMRALATFT